MPYVQYLALDLLSSTILKLAIAIRPDESQVLNDLIRDSSCLLCLVVVLEMSHCKRDFPIDLEFLLLDVSFKHSLLHPQRRLGIDAQGWV